MTTSKISKIILMIFISLTLAACDADEVTVDPDIGLIPAPSPSDNQQPVAVIVATPENAAPGEKITLSATSSFDPDDDKIAYYYWKQTDVNVVTLSGSDLSVTSFIAPEADVTLTFRLDVADEHGLLSEPAEVKIQITEIPPPPPPPPPEFKSVVVSTNDGDDSNSGSYLEPVATIGRGVELAKEKGLNTVYVMEGVYDETVTLTNGIDLIGGVTSFDDNGDPELSASPDKTTEVQSVAVPAVNSAVVKNFEITGSLVIEGSNDIKIEGNSFVEACTHIAVGDSSNVTITKNSFSNSGDCDDFIGIDIQNSQGTKITDSNYFALTLAGNEKHITAIQSVGGDEIEISGGSFVNDGQSINGQVTFTAIVVNGTKNAAIKGNSIAMKSGKASTGISLHCSNAAISADVEGNNISLSEASVELSGVRVNCSQPDSVVNIHKNRITLKPDKGLQTTVRGIDATTLLRPMSLGVVNNVIAMPIVSEDLSNKTAVYLSKIGSTSEVDLIFNTIYITGNKGELHAIYSDGSSLPISTLGNLFMVYGSNKNNAAFSIKGECYNNDCLEVIVANLFNANFYNNEMPLIYYYNSGGFAELEEANLCEKEPKPVKCQTGEIAWQGNYIEEMLPVFFEADTWKLLSQYQSFAIDVGPTSTGETEDVNGTPRDLLPDIGAVEY